MRIRRIRMMEMQRRTKTIQRSHLCWTRGATGAGGGMAVVVVVTASLVSCAPVAYWCERTWSSPVVRRWGLAMLRFALVTAGGGLGGSSIFWVGRVDEGRGVAGRVAGGMEVKYHTCQTVGA
ncbi:hypothetical protein QBC39DRAFT_343335 [Podospora conica]|nr:hypothetical protein QBC39DRAFT_343335 [Schizothecium conicum]